MKELLVKIKEEDADLAKLILEKIGAEVLEHKPTKKTTAKKKVALLVSKKEKPVSPTFMFGKWADFDIDARELRKAAWDRSSRFL